MFEFSLPTRAITVPDGPDWLHEIKYDGYRLRLERDGNCIRLITRGIAAACLRREAEGDPGRQRVGLGTLRRQPGDPARPQPDLDRVVPDQLLGQPHGLVVSLTIEVLISDDRSLECQDVGPVDHSTGTSTISSDPRSAAILRASSQAA